MAGTVVYRLSSIDQSIIRSYIRLALCYPCEAVQSKALTTKFTASVRRAVSYMPILAGKVHSVGHEHQTANHPHLSREHRGKVEIRVSTADVENFQASLRYPGYSEYPYTYESLAALGMPATAFIDEDGVLTPLPDMPSGEGRPVFAVQANFIQGGLIVVLYLHHSAADLEGLSTAIRHMSISEDMLPTRKMTYNLLKENSLALLANRKRLCDSMGTPANLSEHPEYDIDRTAPSAPSKDPSHGAERMVVFSMKKLEAARDMVNQRFRDMKDLPGITISTYDVMASMLWKAITRARWPTRAFEEDQKSTLVFPVGIRNRIDPPLGKEYYGNGCMFTTTNKTLLSLSLPYGVGTLVDIAIDVRLAINAMAEAKVRSGIAIIEEVEDVRTLNHPAIDFNKDVFLTNWASLPVGEESALGLGLGPAQYMRKPSRQHAAYGCVMMPANQEEWPVLLQLTADVMQRLLSDPGLMPFISSVA